MEHTEANKCTLEAANVCTTTQAECLLHAHRPVVLSFCKDCKDTSGRLVLYVSFVCVCFNDNICIMSLCVALPDNAIVLVGDT